MMRASLIRPFSAPFGESMSVLRPRSGRFGPALFALVLSLGFAQPGAAEIISYTTQGGSGISTIDTSTATTTPDLSLLGRYCRSSSHAL